MTRVKAISNFANDEYAQGDVFDVDENRLQHLINVEAVVVVSDATPITEKREQLAVHQTPQPQAVQSQQLIDSQVLAQPTEEEVARDADAVDNRPKQV